MTATRAGDVEASCRDRATQRLDVRPDPVAVSIVGALAVALALPAMTAAAEASGAARRAPHICTASPLPAPDARRPTVALRRRRSHLSRGRLAGTEAAFLAQNERAMTRMMKGMSIKPTGDLDRDFVDMMVPHHQGAIDMAVLVLRYGRNEQVRRLAQEIIVDQQQEIAAMRVAVGEPIPPSAPAPTTPSQSPTPMSGMDMR